MSIEFTISKRSKYNFDIIDITGSISHRETQQIQKYIESYTDKKTNKIILNLEDVPFINSNALSDLIEITKNLSKQNINFILMNVNYDINSILIKNNLKNFFKIVDSEEVLMEKEKNRELNGILEQPD